MLQFQASEEKLAEGTFLPDPFETWESSEITASLHRLSYLDVWNGGEAVSDKLHTKHLKRANMEENTNTQASHNISVSDNLNMNKNN